MKEPPGADSRDYLFAFPIWHPSEVPNGFALGPTYLDFDTAVFVPRDDPDWFGRSAHPPRLLLLCRDRLVVVAHSAALDAAVEIPLQELESVESGSLLLLGWICIHSLTGDCRIPYNTRSRGPIDEWLWELRRRWLGEDTNSVGLKPAAFGPPLTLKFRYAVERELDGQERQMATFFQPPCEQVARDWMLSRPKCLPGDLLALTQRRLLWITDRCEGRYEPYGTVAYCAPRRAISAVDFTDTSPAHTLRVHFPSGRKWLIPVTVEERGAAHHFEDLLHRTAGIEAVEAVSR